MLSLRNPRITLIFAINQILFLYLDYSSAADQPRHSLNWEFGVTFDTRIVLYDRNWTEISSVGNKFQSLSAIVYNEIDDRIYFNDKDNNQTSIFAVTLSPDDNHFTQKVVKNMKSEEDIRGIAFDPVGQDLYWTDSKNKRIYKKSIASQVIDDAQVLFQFEDQSPGAIAVDICRRKLYWTASGSGTNTIERGSLSGTKHEVLIKDNTNYLVAIAVDQFEDRMYWIDNHKGEPFSIESASLLGTDRKVDYRGLNNVPKGMAVTQDSILWVDFTNDAVYRINKKHDGDRAESLKKFNKPPRGIVIRSSLVENHGDDEMCKIAAKILNQAVVNSTTEPQPNIEKPFRLCLNGGFPDKNNDFCHCQSGFEGSSCETKLCHNYCLHGECFLTSTGYPQCHCEHGFIGERCEVSVCRGFCLNGGQCTLEENEPVCQCSETHIGRHCEHVKDQEELCRIYCDQGEQFTEVIWNWEERCRCPKNNNDSSPIQSASESNQKCFDGTEGSDFKYKMIFATIFSSLLILLIIVIIVMKCYKPARPKIKKTFVVRKNVTPLTNRPTTEHCEITIEDCCNMNICDTPCFDPKLLEKEISQKQRSGKRGGMSCKDDKKELLNNMVVDSNGDLF